MKNVLPLQNDRKLSVICRVEESCLGPNGADYIYEFCQFAQSKIEILDSDYITWNIVRRKDNTQSEIEYNALTKMLTRPQAEKYLAVFGKNINEFERQLWLKLAALVNEFMGHSHLH